MRLIRVLPVLLSAGLMLSCDEEKKEVDFDEIEGGFPNGPETGPRPHDASSDAKSDATIGAVDAGPTVGPLVSLMAIAPVSDPLLGPVLVGSSLDVKCAVSPRDKGYAVDPKTVKAAVFGKELAPLVTGTLVLQADGVYGATLSMADVPTGAIRVVCSAADSNPTSPETASSEVDTYYDGGPKITIKTPIANSAVPRGNDGAPDFSINFKVEPSPLAAGDDAQAAVDFSTVTLIVRDKPMTLPPPLDGEYTLPIDFVDLVGNNTGTNAISKLDISVSAANHRAPQAAVATSSLSVQVDGKAPDFGMIVPPSGTIVGGNVTVKMTITDDLSGVADGVHADIKVDGATMSKNLKPVEGEQNAYSFTFEAASFPGKSNIPLNFVARDNAGNESTAAYTVRFDTVAPYVSLASPYIRGNAHKTTTWSGRFKVLGDSPQDGDIIESDARIRALVWERGIEVTGGDQTWISGVREGSVYLYAWSADNTQKLIDTDGDANHYCDKIDESTAGTIAPVKIALGPVEPGGSVPPSSADELKLEPAAPAGAAPKTELPDPKCKYSEMYWVLSQYSNPGQPTAVYAGFPIPGDPVACTGVSFDIGVKAGWTCLVAVASDNAGVIGNLGISRPIRVCRELPNDGVTTCPSMMRPPTDLTCLNNCALSPIVDESPLGDYTFEY